VIRGAKAAASQHAAAEAAEATLAAGHGAVDAIIAGFFGAAGADPGVLLAPVVAIVAGFGAGGRAFDGRAAQPGKGAARPRGFVDEATIPAGARIAVPRSLGMLALLHTYRGRATFRQLATPGIDKATAAGAKQRAALLRKVGSAGVLALRAPEVVRALLAAGGPVAGGALTEADLEESAPAETDAVASPLGEGMTAYTSPFPASEQAEAEIVVACDARGVLAALAYVPARSGVALPDLEITAGLDAVPVRRGVTRVPPGTVLPSAAPIGIAMASGGFAAAVGLPGRATLEAAALGELVQGAAIESALSALRERLGARGGVAVLTDGKTARSATA
jgi:gamma-glutamyltranspeptidase/glutathione hydrolase